MSEIVFGCEPLALRSLAAAGAADDEDDENVAQKRLPHCLHSLDEDVIRRTFGVDLRDPVQGTITSAPNAGREIK